MKKNDVFFAIRPTFLKWGKSGQKIIRSECD